MRIYRLMPDADAFRMLAPDGDQYADLCDSFDGGEFQLQSQQRLCPRNQGFCANILLIRFGTVGLGPYPGEPVGSQNPGHSVLHLELEFT